MSSTTLTAGRTAAIAELAAAWRAVDIADTSGDDTGDRLIRDTYRLEESYVASGVLTWTDVKEARELAAAPVKTHSTTTYTIRAEQYRSTRATILRRRGRILSSAPVTMRDSSGALVAGYVVTAATR